MFSSSLDAHVGYCLFFNREECASVPRVKGTPALHDDIGYSPKFSFIYKRLSLLPRSVFMSSVMNNTILLYYS